MRRLLLRDSRHRWHRQSWNCCRPSYLWNWNCLEPELPLLELLDPELPLLELGELGPLAPPELGEDAPELEGADGGVGIEGVVGVLAEGQPINISMTPITRRLRAGATAEVRICVSGNTVSSGL